jgi:hypothetical protein
MHAGVAWTQAIQKPLPACPAAYVSLLTNSMADFFTGGSLTLDHQPPIALAYLR